MRSPTIWRHSFGAMLCICSEAFWGIFWGVFRAWLASFGTCAALFVKYVWRYAGDLLATYWRQRARKLIIHIDATHRNYTPLKQTATTKTTITINQTPHTSEHDNVTTTYNNRQHIHAQYTGNLIKLSVTHPTDSTTPQTTSNAFQTYTHNPHNYSM